MRPNTTINNQAYQRTVYAIFRSEEFAFSACSCPASANLFNLALCEFRSLVTLSARRPSFNQVPVVRTFGQQIMSSSMGSVLSASAILKISDAVIKLICIFVIDFRFVAQWSTKEGARHESMDTEVLGPPLRTVKSGAVIPIVNRRLTNTTPCLSTFPRCYESSKIGHAITAFVTRNVAPFFGFEFFGGKFWSSHSVSSDTGNGLARPIQALTRLSGPTCILT